ncbi:MAG: hypothetical protein NZ699_01795 [Roseiflexus sp.]|nr:hypothetical protein [Roseiflexus sp.]MCS7287844.1 hypothetical protein [Roseiflexus sp.]MDW8147022.1 hypothetical protein [Roseiflexaceae bacterium]MDW8233472.1 hypothetical protein [Roseiflexaceae bacterium]
MSAPRIETLLVSLVVLIATGIALAAAYAPPIPRHLRAGATQEALRKTRDASTAPHLRQHSDDRATAPDAVSWITDAAARQIAGIDAYRQIAAPLMSGIVALMLAIIGVRRRQRTTPAQQSIPLREPVVSARRRNTIARDISHMWTNSMHRVAMFPSAYRRALGQIEVFARFWKWRAARDPRSGGSLHRLIRFRHQRAPALSFPLVEAGEQGDLTGSGSLDTLLSHIARFGHQDDRPSPSPLMEEEKPEDEGKKASDCEKHAAPPENAEEGQPNDQAADNRWVIAALQPSNARPEPDAAEVHQSVTTDNAAAAVAAVLDIYKQRGLAQSEVVFAEASAERQQAQVRLTVIAHPDEARALEDLPAQVEMTLPGSKAQWQRTMRAQSVLTITMHRDIPAKQGSHLLLPVARHQSGSRLPIINRSAPAVSFLPLHTWRHVGFCGGKAIESASAALIDLLYVEAPNALAVTIIDQGQISSFCKGMPHVVPLPGEAADSLIALGRAARSCSFSGATMRPLLIIIVEPSATLLSIYDDLTARLLRRPGAPVYTMLVQSHLPNGARRPHPSFPVVITSGGTAPSTGAGYALPPETVRILTRHIRLERQCYAYDATRLAALTALLRVSTAEPLLPTAWDALGIS